MNWWLSNNKFINHILWLFTDHFLRLANEIITDNVLWLANIYQRNSFVVGKLNVHQPCYVVSK